MAIKHPEAYRICKALIDPKVFDLSVIPDFRDPDVVRFGITPLYTTYEEIFQAIAKMKYILEQNIQLTYDLSRDAVT